MSETTMYSNKADDFKSVKLGEIAEIEMGQSPDSAYVSDDPFNGLPFLQGNAEFGSVSPTPKYGCTQPAKVASKNDVLISVRAPVGDVNIADKAYCIGRGLAAISIENIKPSLAAYLISQNTAALRRVAQGTTFEAINKSDLQNLEILVPPETELPVIAEFLDALDTTIQQSVTIIAKLKSVKQGLLHDLLTRGIDASGQLRPPQDEAPHLYKESPLGWIPKEWDVVALDSVSSTVTSGSRDWAQFYSDEGPLFVRIGNLTREHINFRFDSIMHVRPPQNGDGQRTKLEAGDILISITADLGVIGVVPEHFGEAYINQHVALVRPISSLINSRFVGHYLAGPVMQAYIAKLNDAGAKAGLNLPTIRNLLTAKPSLAEQIQISERLDETDMCISNAANEVQKLTKLKSGLMDDLLTGRVRVTPLLQQERKPCTGQ